MARTGTEAIIFRIPDCDIHKYDKGVDGVSALYDARTNRGPWAYMCQECFNEVGPRQLGTGYGQRLILSNG